MTTVRFADHGTTQQSGNDDGPRLIVAADVRSRAELVGLAHALPPGTGRVFVGAFAGTQRTGGYGVRIERIEREGDRLNIRSIFMSPASGALMVQVITSPAHVVSIARADAAGIRDAVLVDQSGTERARTLVPQSTP